MSLRKLVHEYLEKPPATAGPRIVQAGIMGVIFLNVCAIVMGTVPVNLAGTVADLDQQYPRVFSWVEFFSVLVFSVEYILRLWSITENPRYARPLAGRLRFALTPMALVDFLAIAPSFFYAEFIVARGVRLLRVFRILKLGHYSRAVRNLGAALYSKRAELTVTVFAILVLLVLAASVMYYAEKDAQPGAFSSIPAAMWWGIVTLTTVGYGDMTPATTLGKIAGGVVAIFGIGLVALPAGILGSAFVQQISAPEARKCPHCGKEI